jgi:D-alanine-D-alanine ligase
MTIRVEPDWWKAIFDEVYLLTDARSVCNDEITQREVDLVCELLPIHPGHRILDLCGGHGRHCLELHRRGFRRCTLLDYSEHLLAYARAQSAASRFQVGVIRADARNTGLVAASFDHVMIMGNSLGYIVDADADRQILAEAGRVLRPGGWVLVDVADGAAVRDAFNPSAWHESGPDVVVCRQREMSADRICAREVVLSKQHGLIRELNYSIRLYEPESLTRILQQAGFQVVKVLRDFSPHPSKGDYGFMNRRMVALGQKP